MENLTILPGRNRQGQPEDFISIHLARGRLYTIVGEHRIRKVPAY